MGKKILYIVIIIALVVAGIFVAKQMSEEKEATQTGANTIKNTTKNNEQNEVKENNTIETEVNEIENNVVENETITEIDPEEQAKQIVKENWGEDDSVYFSYDGVKDGKHVVCVREKDTTKALYWYYVDLETGTFEIK